MSQSSWWLIWSLPIHSCSSHNRAGASRKLLAPQPFRSHSQEGKPHFTPPSLSPCRSTIKTIWPNVLMSGLRVAPGWTQCSFHGCAVWPPLLRVCSDQGEGLEGLWDVTSATPWGATKVFLVRMLLVLTFILIWWWMQHWKQKWSGNNPWVCICKIWDTKIRERSLSTGVARSRAEMGLAGSRGPIWRA